MEEEPYVFKFSVYTTELPCDGCEERAIWSILYSDLWGNIALFKQEAKRYLKGFSNNKLEGTIHFPFCVNHHST